MEKQIAKQALSNVLVAIQELNSALRLVIDNCSTSEAKAFRRGVGYALSEIHDRITDPIFREHPELVPSNANYHPTPGPTLSELGTSGSK
jgi:hypothetical protein